MKAYNDIGYNEWRWQSRVRFRPRGARFNVQTFAMIRSAPEEKRIDRKVPLLSANMRDKATGRPVWAHRRRWWCRRVKVGITVVDAGHAERDVASTSRHSHL